MFHAEFINVFFLCTVNGIFMIAGIFLNSVVIISLWRSSQLRKKLCYFMIFLLSCFDLSVVIISHPAVMISAIVWAFGDYDKLFENVIVYTFMLLAGFSAFALLTLNIERFLALAYPFFHERMVTKERLIYFLTFLQLSGIALTTLSFDDIILPKKVVVIVALLFFLGSFIYLNYRAFKIASSKRSKGKIVPNSDQKSKRTKFNLKKMSTCSLAVVCYLTCSFPQIVYSLCILASDGTSSSYQNDIPFYLWAATTVCTNSTFNCLILFWRNTVLRREGMKIVKNIKSRCCCLI